MIQSTRYERRRLKEIARLATGTVLDVGYAQLPNPYLDANNTTGLDLAEPGSSSGYSEELIGSVFDLPSVVENRRFDTVVAAELIEHVEDPYGLLRCLRSVLDGQGLLLVSTPNPLGFPVVLFEAVRSTRWFYTSGHLFYFLPRWVARMLTVTGFKLVDTLPVGLWLPFGVVPWCPVWASYQVIYAARVDPTFDDVATGASDPQNA